MIKRAGYLHQKACSCSSHKAIAELRELEGLAWITALKSTQIRSLVQGEALQLGLFDERNLFEI
ncbi:MAG: hypothetical protein WA446_08240, partial [Steroidobacteraceae bacterium]